MMPPPPHTQRLAALLALLLPGVIASPTTAATPDSNNSWRDDAALRDVCFVDREWGWAVGDHATIWHTRDAGQTWQLQFAPSDDALYGVSFIDRQRGFVVGGAAQPSGAGSSSRGLVLATQDSGASWAALPAHVPALSRVRFFNAEEGIAVGLGSASRPAGVYVTVSGGQGWQPVGGGQKQNWLAADSLDLTTGVTAGVGGRTAQIQSGGLVLREPLDPAGRSLRDVALAPPLSGWLVGDGGLAFSTSDLGRSWQVVESLPARFLSDVDLLAVATFESHVWMAGSPGSVVLHSPDGGRTWERQLTNLLTPLRRVTFVDAECGWAVGDLGVILGTRNGGRSWQTMRGGQRRAAVLALVARSSDLPCETLSSMAADEGYRTVVHALTDPHVAPESSSVDVERRLNQAVLRLGGHAASLSWQFPAPAQRLGLTSSQMFAAIDQRNDGQAADRLRADLVRRIRMWQPDMVLLPSPEASPQRPLDAALHAVALQAIADAQDATTHIRLATDWSLPAWRVDRVMAALPSGSRGTHHIDVQQVGRRLKQPLFDLAAAGRALVKDHEADDLANEAGDSNQEFLFVSGSPPLQTDDLMSGLQIAVGGPARRDWQPVSETDDPLRARRLAQKRRNLRSLLQSSAANPAWLAQAGDMVGELEPDAGAALLAELAEGFVRRGQLPMAAEARQLLVRRYPEHPVSDAALHWLVQFFASGEAAHAYASGAEPLRPNSGSDTARAGDQPIRLASAESPIGTLPPVATLTANLNRDQRLAQATQWVDYAAQSRPLLADDPELRFPWITAQRRRGFTATAERYLLGWEHRDRDNPWQACAAAERWLREPDDSPPALPIAACRHAASRPHLDGKLDEPLWETPSAAHLRSTNDATRVAPAQVRLAYDAEYLYVAVTCPGAPGLDYAVDDRPRPHDAPLEAYDRVRLCLDVDRDYVTWYELDVDARGFTSDRCWGDASWNPEWFVASAMDGRGSSGQDATRAWHIEAAIAWSELVDSPPQSRHVWALALERIIPKQGFQTWSGPAAAAPGPENFGLLIFE